MQGKGPQKSLAILLSEGDSLKFREDKEARIYWKQCPREEGYLRKELQRTS